MNMFKAVKAKTIQEYLQAVPPERKKDFEFLHAFIQKSAPKLKPHFAFNMIGYGSFPYRNYKHEPIEWPVVMLANQKGYMSLHICCADNGKYLAETYAKELGNVKVGKSCIQIKKVSDLKMDTLKKVLQAAQKKPGFGERPKKKK